MKHLVNCVGACGTLVHQTFISIRRLLELMVNRVQKYRARQLILANFKSTKINGNYFLVKVQTCCGLLMIKLPPDKEKRLSDKGSIFFETNLSFSYPSLNHSQVGTGYPFAMQLKCSHQYTIFKAQMKSKSKPTKFR